MVTSPSSSPPPKWKSNLQGGGAGAGSGQLLQELEALSQALYQAQKKSLSSQSYPSQPPPHPQPPPQTHSPPVKRNSFLSRREILPSRRLSHDTSKDASPKESTPRDARPSFTNPLSRHSLSSVLGSPSLDQQKSASASMRSRDSASVVSAQSSYANQEEKADIRSHMDHRFSLKPLPSKNSDKLTSQESTDWSDDPLESSRRFDSSSVDKKKSVWSSWKPLRALSHIGRQRLHCVFSAYVHAIEGLPPAMYGLRLCVHMRKEETKEGAVQTMPSRVFQGIAEFEETLFMKCTLYGNKGPSNAMKFMAKAFIVSVIAPDIDELDFGRHQVDLSRLLGDLMDDRKGQLENGNSWDTILDLTGKAKGGRLAITFNYEILDKDSASSGNVSSRFRDSPPHRSSMHSSYSLPNSAHGTPRTVTTRAHLNHSPSASEPGNDYDDLLAMDQLSLDEPPPVSAGDFEARGSQTGAQVAEVQGFPAFRSQTERPLTPSQGSPSAFPSGEKHQALPQNDHVVGPPMLSLSMKRETGSTPIFSEAAREEDGVLSEDDADFVVVEQGMEIGDSVKKFPQDVVVKDLDGVDEISGNHISHVMEMDAMDDLPQVIDVEVLHQEVVRDDLSYGFSAHVVETEALDDPIPQEDEMEALDDPIPQEDEMEDLDDPTAQVDEMKAFNDQCQNEDKDDLTSQMLEKSQARDLQGHEAGDNELQTEPICAVERVVDDKEVHEYVEKIVTVDEGEKESNVTYLMVMQTLDSLLQGTSAKELPQEEEKAEVVSSAEGIFRDEEDSADKDVSKMQEIDYKSLIMDENTDVHEVSKDLEYESDNEDIDFESANESVDEEEDCDSKDIKDEEVFMADVAEDNRGYNIFEMEECKNVVRDKENKDNYFEAEKDIYISEEAGGGCNKLDEERGDHTFEEEDSGDHAFEEEDRGVHVFAEEERGVHVFVEDDREYHTFEEDSGVHVFAAEDTVIKNLEEEEGGGQSFEEEESGNNDFKEEQRDVYTFEVEKSSEVSDEEEGNGSVKEEETHGSDVFEEEEDEKNAHVKEERGSNMSDMDAEEKERCSTLITNQGRDFVVSQEEQVSNTVTEGEMDSSVLVQEKIEIEKTESEFKLLDDNLVSEEAEKGNQGASVGAEFPQESTYKEIDSVDNDDIDNEVDLVAGEFLDMLGIGFTTENKNYDSEADSPRARLLKQYEEEALLEGGFGLDLEVPEFLLDGPYRDGDVGASPLPPFSSQETGSQAMPKESATRDYRSLLMGRDSETANWCHTSPLKEHPAKFDQQFLFGSINREPANWDHNLDLKSMGDESAVYDHTLDLKGLDKEPAKRDNAIDLVIDEGSPKWNHTSVLKGMEEELANWELSLAQKGTDLEKASLEHTCAMNCMDEQHAGQDYGLDSEGMDEVTRQDNPLVLESAQEIPDCHHTSTLEGLEKKPPKWDATYDLSRMNEEPAVVDRAFTSEWMEKGPSHHEVPSKEPATRGPDSLPEGAENESTILDLEDGEDFMSIMEAAESEHQRATQSMRSRSRAKMLEDEETEALMQEWGLNEKAFVSSPPKPTMSQQTAPPLGKGLGAAVPLKDGGSLRSMNSSHFQAHKASGKLVMQISKPIVVPAEMGSETVDILRNMASMGVENMALQAMTAMPMEDITGRSAEQVAAEGIVAPKPGHRLLQGSLASRKELNRIDRKSRSPQNIGDDFVSLEDIAPMAMQHIEALAMDGLKVQSDVTEDEAPFTLNAFSVDGQPSEKDLLGGSAIVKGITGVHLSKGARASAETSGDIGNTPMGMAISLDEWMLLDAGLYDETETTDHALAIMAAHSAAHQDMVLAGGGGEDDKRKKRQGSKNTGGRWGCMGNTLTIAMLVQLRDPLKNNEAVGAPMMAFVQAERMMKPPKMKVGRNVSMKGNSEDEEAGGGIGSEEPQFKVTGVHMAGLKDPEQEKKVGWGNQKQLQSGSRWLIANGMSKNAKAAQARPMLASKASSSVASPASTAMANNAGKGESIWSLSARVFSSGLKWKDKLKLNPHIRHPDVVAHAK